MDYQTRKSQENRPLIHPNLQKKDSTKTSSLSSWKLIVISMTIMLSMIAILTLFILFKSSSSSSPSIANAKINTHSNDNDDLDHLTGTDPFANWEECDSVSSPPLTIAYHMHAVFDGNNQDSINYAYSFYHSYMNYVNPDMQVCAFAHSMANVDQKEICYFPTTFNENDYPLPSNIIFGTANYAFFIPPNFLSDALEFWSKRHMVSTDSDNNFYFDYVIHTVSGCQVNDHSKWLLNNPDYKTHFDDPEVNNLLCCHNGPSLCTCNMVQYEMDGSECLGIQFGDNDVVSFVKETDCDTASTRNVGSWREVLYDDGQNWNQIENYGDTTHPIYLCMVVDDSDDGDVCEIGKSVMMDDCSVDQDVMNDVWIAKRTQLKFDTESLQIKVLGCDRNLCVDVVDSDDDDDSQSVDLKIASCGDATTFVERHFFP